ncbi:MAG: N-acetylmuramidase family protein [Phenylobacterium sp.]|uniref:N-acetylmuramidase family protein n=1 Tax=Phenylobacterium sp. TaxID=1871053 RepID=UPI003BB8128D
MKIEDLTGAALPLTDADVRAACDVLRVSPAHVRAVMEIESNGRGFHPETRRPVILFEPHIFSRETGGRFDAGFPDLSYPKWGAKPYVATQRQRYEQLQRAMELDLNAAIRSASWGLFQIMGFNAPASGFPNVQDFARAMAHGEGEQLLAFARFVASRAEMLAALQKGDWAGFARRYNGPGFAQHGYDQKLKAAFQRHLGDRAA